MCPLLHITGLHLFGHIPRYLRGINLRTTLWGRRRPRRILMLHTIVLIYAGLAFSRKGTGCKKYFGGPKQFLHREKA